MAKNKSRNAWFTPVRNSYLPASGLGFAIYLSYVIYIIAVAIDWYHDGHHVWYLLINVIPLCVGAALVTQYIASKHSK